MHNTYRNTGFLLICILLLFSCSKNNENQPDKTNSPQSVVYVAGIKIENQKNIFKQWVSNNVDSMIEKGIAPHYAILTDAIFYNGDVYFVGYEAEGGGKHVAKYWKNGVATEVSDKTVDAYAYTIAIDNDGVIYMGGCVENSEPNIKSIAKYWKVNTDRSIEEVTLSDGHRNASIFSLALDNGNVYAAGRDGNGVAKYWINDKDHSEVLTGGHTIYAITVVDGKVYTAGWYNDPTGRFSIKYWVDGKPHDLTNGVHFASVSGITVNNGDVYVCGYVDATPSSRDVAKYWKNGITHDLTDGTHAGIAMAITVHKGDVYVAGYERKDTSFINPGNYIAKYWKNDSTGEVALSDGNSSEEAYAIHAIEE